MWEKQQTDEIIHWDHCMYVDVVFVSFYIGIWSLTLSLLNLSKSMPLSLTTQGENFIHDIITTWLWFSTGLPFPYRKWKWNVCILDFLLPTCNNKIFQVDSDICGNSQFQAAKTKGKSFKGQDETGAVVGCCKHCVIMRGLNMFRGEVFAYPLCLLHDMIGRGFLIHFMCQDVICKFWPWLARVMHRLPADSTTQKIGNVKPFLGVMHGKAHSWSCQVINCFPSQ